MKPVFILKGKLYHVDNVVPLAHQLYCEKLFRKAVFVVPSSQDRTILEENRASMAAITHMGTLSNLTRRPPVKPRSLAARLGTLRPIRLARNLWVLRHYLLGRVLSFEMENGRWLDILTNLNRRLYGGRRIFLVTDNLPFSVSYSLKRSVERAYGREFRRRFPPCFAIVGSHSRADAEKLEALEIPPNTPWIEIGYSRGLASWLRHLRDVEERIDAPYAFFPLSVLRRKEPNGREYKFYKSLEVILGVLREFEKDVKVVFRYHPTTDRTHFNEILKRSGMRNFEISFAHPLHLISRANFMITYGGSTLTSDAWLLSCRTIEFGQPGASLYEDLNESAFAQVTDHFIYDDIDELRRVVRAAIDANGEVESLKRDDVHRLDVLDGAELARRLGYLFEASATG